MIYRPEETAACDSSFCTDNPMHAVVEMIPTLVPVANTVIIDVAAESVYDEQKAAPPTSPSALRHDDDVEEPPQTWSEVTKDMMVLLCMLSFLGGFIVFLIWMNKPSIVGAVDDH